MFKGSYLFQTIISGIHVIFRECSCFFFIERKLPKKFTDKKFTKWNLRHRQMVWYSRCLRSLQAKFQKEKNVCISLKKSRFRASDIIPMTAGQIIATSHDLTPKGSVWEGKWDPLFQGYLGWWNIIIWPDLTVDKTWDTTKNTADPWTKKATMSTVILVIHFFLVSIILRQVEKCVFAGSFWCFGDLLRRSDYYP